MQVKLFCAFRSRHPHPWLYTPLPIDTHLYFYHHPTAPTAGIVYDTIRLIISCLYATIDRTANCTRHSDSKTVPPRALLQPFRSKTGFFFFERVTKPAKLVLLDSPLDSVIPFRDLSSIRTTVRMTFQKCSMDTSLIVHRCNHFVYDRNNIRNSLIQSKNVYIRICCAIINKIRDDKALFYNINREFIDSLCIFLNFISISDSFLFFYHEKSKSMIYDYCI